MLYNYLTEIISKRDWVAGPRFRDLVKKRINFKEYKANLKILKSVFKTLNKGKYSPTIIFDYESIKVENKTINEIDYQIIKLLEDLGYEVSQESYLLGFGKKGDKAVILKNVLEAIENKNLDSMYNKWVETGNRKIKMQMDSIREFYSAIQNLEIEDIKFEDTHAYMIHKEKGYKIVLSIQPRLIASQSTDVGWTSCMDLVYGQNSTKVGEGIGEGVIIAYLAKIGDEKSLRSPSARVLVKPYKSAKGNEIVWMVDRIYGTTSESFKEKVQKIFQPINAKAASGNYRPRAGVYIDELPIEVNKK